MKRFTITSIVVMVLFGFSGIAGAMSYTITPEDHDLYDLDHGRAYKWGVDLEIPDGETIVGASLLFEDIRNWNSSINDLWVRLIDTAYSGITQYYDGYYGQADYFAGQGTFLEQWHNIPAIPQDITYTFDAAEIAALQDYVSDGNFGLTFDPDCHFYNNGVSLIIETADPVVPEPSTVLLLGSGVLGLIAMRRRRKK